MWYVCNIYIYIIRCVCDLHVISTWFACGMYVICLYVFIFLFDVYVICM